MQNAQLEGICKLTSTIVQNTTAANHAAEIATATTTTTSRCITGAFENVFDIKLELLKKFEGDQSKLKA